MSRKGLCFEIGVYLIYPCDVGAMVIRLLVDDYQENHQGPKSKGWLVTTIKPILD